MRLHRPIKRTYPATCPTCPTATTPATARLKYSDNRQYTECPNGHEIYRDWNGPENPFYNKSQPYGWTEWKEA